MTGWLAAVVFVGSGAVLTWGGVLLARAGDELAERTGLGRLFVGMLIVALATSLPELVTGISAALGHAPDLAVGDLVGSSMANMAILAIIDLPHRGRVWPHVELGHARVASVAIGLTALAGLAVLTPPGVSVGWVGIDTIGIGGAYVAAVAWIRRSPLGRGGEPEVLPTPVGLTTTGRGALSPVMVRFAVATAVVLVAAPLVAFSGREIAAASRAGRDLRGHRAGGAVHVAARAGDRCCGGADRRPRPGGREPVRQQRGERGAAGVRRCRLPAWPAARAVDVGQAVAAVGAIVLMALALTAIVHGAETRIRRLEPDAVVLLLAYVGALFAMWSVRQ